MAGFDILLVTAIREAFGRIIVEAALAGTPVVASDVGGHREAISHGETGLLVPSRDPQPMANAAVTLLNDTARGPAMAAAAREVALERYDAPKIAGTFAELYRDIAG